MSYIYCKVIFIIHAIYCNFNTKNWFNRLLSFSYPRNFETTESALSRWFNVRGSDADLKNLKQFHIKQTKYILYFRTEKAST